MLPADSIRRHLDIVRVVGGYMRLTRSGRNYRGVSPFSDDATESLFVFPGSQTFKDFSSGKQGDVFAFVMLKEGWNFKEALLRLAEQVGLGESYDIELKEAGSEKANMQPQFATEAFARIAARAAPIAPEDFSEYHDEYIAKLSGLLE